MTLPIPATCLLAAASPSASGPSGDLLFWIVLLCVMALAPFVLTMITSFAKLVIVGGILRHALGTQQIPPNTVITGLALILTVHIMAPVAIRIHEDYLQRKAALGPAINQETPGQTFDRVLASVEPPIRQFLIKHSHNANRELFRRLQARLRKAHGLSPTTRPALAPSAAWDSVFEDITIHAPAFILTELTEAFQIGFLIFVPFLVIDLVVSNILLAMGMQMLSPVTISMPLKLLLFVLIDGWKIILQGLVLGYT